MHEGNKVWPAPGFTDTGIRCHDGTGNNKIGVPEIALLRVLSECPQGATEYTLVTRHNVVSSTIFKLVEAGLLHSRTQRMVGISWSATWLMISGAGRVVLNKAESEQSGLN